MHQRSPHRDPALQHQQEQAIEQIDKALYDYLLYLLEQNENVVYLLEKQSRGFILADDDLKSWAEIVIQVHQKDKKEEWVRSDDDVNTSLQIFQIHDNGYFTCDAKTNEMIASEPYFYQSTSSEAQLIKKINAVQRLRAVLANDVKLPDPRDRLQTFHSELNSVNGQEGLLANRMHSTMHAFFRDTYWKRVVTNCLAILTAVPGIILAIHSKFFTPKKSFNFMALEGDVVMNNVNIKVSNALKK